MPFPEVEHVTYERNPLFEVVCQFRFPPILRVAAELPVAYQEALGSQYTLIQQGPVVGELQLPPAIANTLKVQLGAASSPATYVFGSEDERWRVTIESASFAVSTSKYLSWLEFKEVLIHTWEPFVQLYKPSKLTRIGLRYQDGIQRSALGLAEVPWYELVQPYIASELGVPNINNRVLENSHQFVMGLDRHEAKVRVRHGLATNEETKEICYLIDSDFFTEQKTEPTEAKDVLDDFHEQAWRLFQWCIKPSLHEAMGPT